MSTFDNDDGGFKFDLGDAAVAADTKLDPSEGDWVFKQDGVVLGPVSAAILLQRIDEGELDAEAPIGRTAGEWTPLKEIPYFYKSHRRAEARIRRIEAQSQHDTAMRSRRMVRLASFGGLAIIPLLLGAVVGRTVMVQRPWDDSGDWAERAPPLVDLKPKPKVVVPPKPSPTAEPAEGEGEGEVASDKDKDKRTNKRTNKRSSKDKRAREKRAKEKKERERLAALKKRADKDPVRKAGSPLSEAQVTKGFKKGFGDYKRCIKAEFSRDKDLPVISVRIEFTVTEGGKAINTRVRERQFRGGPLDACLKKAVGKLRWPKFTGERRNAVYPLRAKRP